MIPRLIKAFLLLLSFFSASLPATEVIPHAQSAPPGPALSPAEALKKMKVPEGFTVELVASEPDIVNPVAMTIDEKGRFWITESLEYPRREAGPGRDRIKILEDTDGDGKIDKVTVFAEGLNIPSGIAVGYGGVWVANAPDILFMQDTDGDGKADKQEVIVTGFGRFDTHELPNSLTWGPDGWLYGLNGVFNPAHIKHKGKEYKFTCAMFRIHPRTRDFEVFCEGTSNPWGIAFDPEGCAFVSACVIDHLWHLTETGYYLRQGGPYPPHTWILPSIVGHKHQKAAYCGIHYFDSDAYPEKYRDKLYMGNIHGGCINVDSLTRDGSTYRGKPEPDFLTANDAWFMPVVQKTGPDGCLYILDWYDRYHCYQDANRDPKGIEREKGRLYRVRYKDTPRAPKFDLAKETDEQLIERLKSPNVYFRDVAQRILAERNKPVTRALLEKLVLDDKVARKARMHGMWALIGGGSLATDFHLNLLFHEDDGFQAWGVRAAGNQGRVDPRINNRLKQMAESYVTSAKCYLQLAIAARKIDGGDSIHMLLRLLRQIHLGHAIADDKLLTAIFWQNLQPLVDDHTDTIIGDLKKMDLSFEVMQSHFLPRLGERIFAKKNDNTARFIKFVTEILDYEKEHNGMAGRCLALVRQKIQNHELAGSALDELKEQTRDRLLKLFDGSPDNPTLVDAALLLAAWKDPKGLPATKFLLMSTKHPPERRVEALEALAAAGDVSVLEPAASILDDARRETLPLRGAVLSALSRLDHPRVAEIIVAKFAKLEPELQPRAIEVLTQRSVWAKTLLQAIQKQAVSATALNVNQVRKLLLSPDKELVALVKQRWGLIRTERNPAREKVIAEVRNTLRNQKGDPHKGVAVFQKICSQCHKIHGQGQEVGPDLTSNGRESVEQILVNVLDPNQVIGTGYQARNVVTKDGRVLVGLAVEESDQRVVLKIAGSKLETIPRKEIEEISVNPVSLMPEELEKQLSQEELVNLFSFLSLDKPPSDPTAKRLPEERQVKPRRTMDLKASNEILAEVAPGFVAQNIGDGGIELLAKYRNRNVVVRTHPVSRNVPTVLKSRVFVPKDKKAILVLEVGHDTRGDWQLVVMANGKKLFESLVDGKTAKEGWARFEVDLSTLAGQEVDLELHNAANDWSYEFAYWSNVAVVTEEKGK